MNSEKNALEVEKEPTSNSINQESKEEKIEENNTILEESEKNEISLPKEEITIKPKYKASEPIMDEKPKETKKSVWKIVKPYIVIIIIVVLIRTFIITPARVNGESMEPTLYDGQIVIVNKIIYTIGNINRFDMVVVKHEDETLIKRVVGMPNEKIVYKDNKLYVNDMIVTSKLEFEDTADFTYTTKENEYYCLGDNRDISKDSRAFGPFKRNEISGKVNLVIFPFGTMGLKE